MRDEKANRGCYWGELGQPDHTQHRKAIGRHSVFGSNEHVLRLRLIRNYILLLRRFNTPLNEHDYLRNS